MPDGPAADLGSGGGVPGLAVALAWPQSQWSLIEAGERRADFLVHAVARLELEQRVKVVPGRAETLAHDPDLRGAFALVVARSFGPPGVTAECAAGLLRVRARLVVSEPPVVDADRWPPAGLAMLGMRPVGTRGGEAEGPRFQVIKQEVPCPPRYPRRVGIPAKRPLF